MKKLILKTALIFFLGGVALHPVLWAMWPIHGERRANISGRLYWHGNKQAKKVALTFDDGPSEPYTSQILDILKNENVKGTFFMLGKNVQKYPLVARRIVEEGHTIGNHSYSHSDVAFLSKKGGRREMEWGESAIEKTTGVRPRFFRPPHGRLNGFMLKQAKKMGLITVQWTISPQDWKAPPPDFIVQRILSRAKNGSIVLMHDGYFLKKPQDRSSTVLALPRVIHELRMKGFDLVTVPDILALNEPSLAMSKKLSYGSVEK